MNKSLYCYEKGECRGYGFGDKVVLNVKQTIDTMNQAIELKAIDEDAYEEFVDNIGSENEDSEANEMVYHLINGSDVVEEKVTIQDRIQLIKDGKSFHITLEESDIGFGPSKKEAKLAYVEVAEDGEEW